MINYNQSELEKKAVTLGATHLRHIFVDVSIYVSYTRLEVFSTHFFDSNDNEIGYYIDSCGLVSLCGLTTFETPRAWSLLFKNHRLTGKPVDFKTRCIVQSSFSL